MKKSFIIRYKKRDIIGENISDKNIDNNNKDKVITNNENKITDKINVKKQEKNVDNIKTNNREQNNDKINVKKQEKNVDNIKTNKGEKTNDTMPKVDIYLASLWRSGFLVETLNSLLRQPECATITAVLNNYTDEQYNYIKSNITDDRVKLFRHKNEKEDNEKIYYINTGTNEFVAICDDDLIYPEDYLSYMIKGCIKYNAVVSLHGSILHNNINNYYYDRTVFKCMKTVTEDVKVDVVGTGVLLFKRDFFDNLRDLYKNAPDFSVCDLYFSYFAYSNNIPCYVLSHKEGYLKHKKIEKDDNYVYDYYSKNHTKVTEYANKIKKILDEKKTGVSIIISIFGNEDYIFDTIKSIQEQTHFVSNQNYEIIIGVDGSIKTLNKINEIKHNFKNLRVFYSEQNYGQYLMFNSLILKSTYENIIIFGSDDIMLKNFVEEVIKCIDNKSMVLPFCYDWIPEKNKKELKVHDGIVGYTKTVFNVLNGYAGWRCGADSDFKKRCEMNGFNIKKINKPLYLRRLHGNNLTRSKKYGFGSEYRNNIINEINNRHKKGIIKNEILETIELEEIL